MAKKITFIIFLLLVLIVNVIVRAGNQADNSILKATNEFSTNALPDKNICGPHTDEGRIFGGSQTQLDEFPWLVALEYVNNNGSDVGIRCGGTLINKRYILTAAHCTRHPEFNLTRARLGDWDVTKDPDCIRNTAQEECAPNVVKIDIVKQIPYPYFTSHYNDDIALLKLAEEVKYSDYIAPICLPLRSLKIPYNTPLTISGWGLTENGTVSNIKLKADVPLLDNNICQNKMLRKKRVGANQLCAGGESGKDACAGDSGGPLMWKYEDFINKRVNWYLDGIISFGNGCARLETPAVYTKIDRYIRWIIRTVEERKN